MKRFKTLEFYGGRLQFSAGHFTIFSSTHREKMHGHNYSLQASMTAALSEPGITFDYGIFRDRLTNLCRQLHSYFLLPGKSPYLNIIEENDYYYAEFNHKKMPFLKEDVIILPLSNITLEELSHWFLQELLKDEAFIQEHEICEITIKVFNGPEHSASALWRER